MLSFPAAGVTYRGLDVAVGYVLLIPNGYAEAQPHAASATASFARKA